jgi:(p)ppGpp synthase/HD superfamily hydrolase
MTTYKEWLETKKGVKKAFDFAEMAHAGQYRKIDKDGEKLDYFSHPKQVAELVYLLKNSKEIESLVMAALLHDVAEDTEYTLEEIKETFGELVFSLVKELTNNPVDRGDMSKEKYLIKKMLQMTSWGLVIKLCDILHNIDGLKFSKSKDEIKFAKYYINQTKNIMNTLKEKRDLTGTQKTIIGLIEDKLGELVF